MKISPERHAERSFEEMRFYAIPVNAFKACIFMYEEILKSNPTWFIDSKISTSKYYENALNHILLMQKKYNESE
jgi:hypothetical protein